MGVKRYNGIGMVTEDEFNTGLAGKLDKPDAAGNENDVLTKTADGGEVWAPVSSTGTPADSAMSDSSTNAVQNKVIKQYVDDTADTKANKDGRYDLMVVGAALNLDAPITTDDAFLVRPTGGADVEAADGVAQITEAEGNSVKFNQLAQNKSGSNAATDVKDNTQAQVITLSAGITLSSDIVTSPKRLSHVVTVPSDTTYFIIRRNGQSIDYILLAASTSTNTALLNKIKGHKVYWSAEITAVAYNVVGGYTWDNVVLIDLTDIFGSGNEPSTVEQVEAWLAENIGAMAYYPYTAGTVLNNCMEGIAAPGYNLLDPATGKAVIIGEYSDLYGNYYGIVGTHGALTFTDAYGNSSTITPDSDGKFELTVPGELSVASAGDDCAVFLWWDGTKKEYQPYELNESFLDVKHIYGKLNGEGDLVQVWPTGMPKIGALIDKLHNVDGAAVADRILGEVDMGDMTWTKSSGIFYGRPNNTHAETNGDVLCAKYPQSKVASWNTLGPDKTINTDYLWTDHAVNVKDSDYSSGDASAFKTAMSGVKLYYQRTTALRYTDLVYQGSSHFADGTPVVLPVTYKVNNWSIESIIPQNTTSALVTAPPVLTCKYSLGAVDLLNTHTDEIADLYATKADTEGSYPGIISGNLVDVNGVGTDQEFVYRPTGGGEALAGNGNGVFQAIKGRTLVWNQILQNGNFAETGDWAGVSGSIAIADNKCIWTAGNNVNQSSRLQKPFSTKSGHKYLIAFFAKGSVAGQFRVKFDSSDDFYVNYSAGVRTMVIGIVTASSSGTYLYLYPNFTTTYSEGDTCEFEDCGTIDLTAMFQAGNEPSTVAEFTALFPESYYAYNSGTLLPYKGTGLKVTGVNQWDEQWEDGDINASTGAETIDTTRWRSGFIPLISGKTYYYKAPAATVYARHFFYDSAKNFISAYSSSTYLNNNINKPANAAFMRFVIVKSAYGTTYNHDICINISNASLNGQYFPYEERTLSLPIVGKTAKDGDGNPIVPYPTGMHGTPTAYDVATKVGGSKVMGIVDLGTLNWNYSSAYGFYAGIGGYKTPKAGNNSLASNILCTGFFTMPRNSLTTTNQGIAISDSSAICCSSTLTDSDAFKESVSGVYLVYELATPVPFTWDEPLEMIYPAPAGGTEAIIPQGVDESGVPATAPLRATIFYSKDYVQTINDTPKDFDTTASIDALTMALATTLSTALNGTLTITRGAYDESAKKYAWTVSFTTDEEE